MASLGVRQPGTQHLPSVVPEEGKQFFLLGQDQRRANLQKRRSDFS